MKQSQKMHNKGKSIPLKIPGLDPIKMFFLDIIYLIYLRVMKWFLKQWTSGKRGMFKLSSIQKELFRKTLLELSGISDDFQQKEFDLNDLSNWKATQ